MGDGTFNPTGSVTGLQFAKMLLCALGYGVNGEYTGEGWGINAAKDALSLGVFAGNLAGADNTAATREECALYAFNILWLDKVNYSALLGGYVSNAEYGLVNVNANTNANIADDFKLSKAKADADDAFGRPTGYYYTVNSKKATANYRADATLLGSYTTPVSESELYALLGAEAAKAVGAETDPVVVTNLYDGTTSENTIDSLDKTSKEAVGDTAYGVETYVYATKNAAGKITAVTVVSIDTYLDTVASVNEKAGTVTLTTSGKTIETTDYAKDDYVLVQYTAEGAETAAAVIVGQPTVVTSTISKYTNNGVAKITASGTTYTVSENDAVTDGTNGKAINNSKVDGTDYTLIVDQNGYLIGLKDVDVDNTYVYVAKIGEAANGTDGNGFVENAYKAVVYYADGTNGVVTLDKDASNYDTITSNKTAGLYILKGTSDKATLSNSDADNSGSSVKKGVSTIEGTNKADSKTVFYYVTGTYDGGDLKVTVYTGISNIPYAADAVTDVPYYAEDNVVKAVLMKDIAAADGTTAYLYTGKYTVEGNNTDGYTVTFEVYTTAGEKTAVTYKFDTAAKAQAAISTAANVENAFSIEGTTSLKADTDEKHVANVTVGGVDEDTLNKTYPIADATVVDLRTNGTVNTVKGLVELYKDTTNVDTIVVNMVLDDQGNATTIFIISASKEA
jgi:hypothetical protein